MLQTPEGAVIPTPSSWITNILCNAAKEKTTKDNKFSLAQGSIMTITINIFISSVVYYLHRMCRMKPETIMNHTRFYN